MATTEDAPKNDLTKAEHFLEKFEKHVSTMRGKPFPLSYDDKEALKRVKALAEKYPDDFQVSELFKRARSALMASKGDFIDITPEMLAYKTNEEKLVKNLSILNLAAWEKYLAGLKQEGTLLDEVFPAPDPMGSDPELFLGKRVILDDFRYPDNEFTETGGQYVFAGDRTRGYYFVELSTRAWVGVYEALKRYRDKVSRQIPVPWRLVGRITSVRLLVPQAGEEKTMSAWYGWLVTPEAIWVPGRVLAIVQPGTELGGTYTGEDQIEELKREFYTVTEVPEKVEPIELVRIFATAIKEKNWDLYLDCIDPARKATQTAIGRLRYFYVNNLERYDRFYVYVDPYELSSVTVIKGFRVEEGSVEDFFLDDSQKAALREHSEPIVEEAVVMIRTFDEHGKQSALTKKVVLRRYDSGRWYISSGYPL